MAQCEFWIRYDEGSSTGRKTLVVRLPEDINPNDFDMIDAYSASRLKELQCHFINEASR
jgi:hypothetical protein